MARMTNVRLFRGLARPTFPLLLLAAAIMVIDADTVEQDGQRWRIIDIDAPEIHRAHCHEERRRGILAAARLIQLLAERGGRLEASINSRGKPQLDKHGRMLGRLYLGEEDWSAIAIAEGHAIAWNGKGRPPDWCTSQS